MNSLPFFEKFFKIVILQIVHPRFEPRNYYFILLPKVVLFEFWYTPKLNNIHILKKSSFEVAPIYYRVLGHDLGVDIHIAGVVDCSKAYLHVE